MNYKPTKYGHPCTHCGLCCQSEPCPIGVVMFGKDKEPPCPAILPKGGRYLCTVVLLEERLPADERIISKALGIGCGCSMPDPDTTDEEMREFDKSSITKLAMDRERRIRNDNTKTEGGLHEVGL